MNHPNHDDEECGLVMPFVVTKSKGGEYDDQAFVAGCRFQQDWDEIKAAPCLVSWANYVYPAMLPQYDLLAMHYGFEMTSEPWSEAPDEWVLVILSRPKHEVEI